MSFDKGKKAKKFLLVCAANLVFYRFIVHFVAKNLIRIRKTATNGVLPKVAVFCFFVVPQSLIAQSGTIN